MASLSNGRIGRRDHPPMPSSTTRWCWSQADLGRPDAIDRRQVSHQHEIDAVEAPLLLGIAS